MSAPRRQRGIALLLLVAALAMGATWYMVKRLRELNLNNIAADRAYNAQVLSHAKQALIGYVIAQANKTGENNPGNIPCPEAPTSFNQTNGTDGRINTSGCTASGVPAVGRYPWRTIGTEQFKDTAGEPLWYVVSPGWAITGIGANTLINSNSTGQLIVDGGPLSAGDTVVALLIAPGPAINVPASSGCTAWSQSRPATAGLAPDWRNYLECENASSPADVNFVTSGPSGAFNDQVVKITVSDLMPGLEAAIADRIQREIVPALKTTYAGTAWGLTGSNVYPFAAPFANPSTSAMQGTLGTLAGLLPMTHAETSPLSGTLCTVGSDTRCAPSFVSWTSASLSGASIFSPTCATTASQINCSFYYRVCLFSFLCGTTTTVPYTVTGTASNVGMALRQLNSSTANMTNVSTASVTATLNTDGSATATITGNAAVSSSGTGLVSNLICTLSGFLGIEFGCKQSTLSIPITVFADNSLLDASTASSTGWFARNKWHELTYYATVNGYSPARLTNPPSCNNQTLPLHVPIGPPTGNDCLGISNLSSVTVGGQRALLILAGRSINANSRPSTNLSDYLEFGNATPATSPYEFETVSGANLPALKRPFNDRIVVVDTN